MNIKNVRYLNCRHIVRTRGGISALANKLDKQQSQVSSFAGANPKKGIGDKIAEQIEKAYGLDAGWMDRPHPELWEYDPVSDKTQIRVGESLAEYMVPISAWDDSTPIDDDEVARPFFNEVEASAGLGAMHGQENHGPKIRFSRRSLSKKGVLEQNAYAISVTGDSMLPVLRDGTTIGIDVGSTSIIDGQMYAIDHDGMLRVKVLYRQPSNQIRIHSYNPEYPDEKISLATEGNFRILGRVFWYAAFT